MKMIIAVGSIVARVDTLVQMEADLNVGLPSYLTPRVTITFPRSYMAGSHL